MAKKMRENEITMEEMTGYRMKIVERGGIKLENLLLKDMWEGDCCGRDTCLLCETKLRNEKAPRKSCTKRNFV